MPAKEQSLHHQIHTQPKLPTKKPDWRRWSCISDQLTAQIDNDERTTGSPFGESPPALHRQNRQRTAAASSDGANDPPTLQGEHNRNVTCCKRGEILIYILPRHHDPKQLEKLGVKRSE
ncbi:MAG: hypothetical protein B6I37_02740 [Desulfobacteraceae bacterium 4572_35.2]|nr:MAG: hypothetical protein B6I37_02740 [Desulfobacteraceae bacterium 4572_35.2]